MVVIVTRSISGSTAVVDLVGEHDLASVDVLRRELERTLTCSLVVLDLESTTFLDSSAIGVLLGATRRIREHGGRVQAVRAHGIAERALRLVGVAEALGLDEPALPRQAYLQDDAITA